MLTPDVKLYEPDVSFNGIFCITDSISQLGKGSPLRISISVYEFWEDTHTILKDQLSVTELSYTRISWCVSGKEPTCQ